MATLTPFPLLAALAYYKLRARWATTGEAMGEEKEGLQMVRETDSTSPIIKEEKLAKLLEEDSQDNSMGEDQIC